MKTVPLRKCVATNERLPKNELVRVVKNNEGKVFVDLTGKANGRGAYLKKDLDVINKAQKSKQLNRHLETEINDSIYDELRSYL